MVERCQSCCWWRPNQETVEQTEDGKYECRNPELAIRTSVDFGCTLHLAPDSREMNVPVHAKHPTMIDHPNPNPVDGPTQILIVTYRKDFPWLDYALKSIAKHCSGFQGVTIVVPAADCEVLFRDVSGAVGPNMQVRGFDEAPGRGMLHHMVKMAEADLIVPNGTKYVLHTDADCIFKMPTTPEHYFWNDKPYYLIRSWSSLGYPDPRHPTSKAISDCAQWKGPTDAQLGWDTEWYTMCLNTAVMPIDFYKPYREHIAALHNLSFEAYMLSGRNQFPQDRMDWTAMGAWAHKFMHDRFTWFDVEQQEYPIDRKRAYWSHGGISTNIRSEIESFLK